ncbi:DUF885 domain-containing protein [Dyella flagellata]|uniref:DUF885 domain-containing protein n=1 Tax=Dyella flagellata TaxID=1867833 RepID=A0ABQ5XBA9_9GAMM|nr:DUF885 domain-containing protein [Dyella flagellata]GLQ87906.1 hypothetical protein GCM10007898_14740 [Dyella flagellata]
MTISPAGYFQNFLPTYLADDPELLTAFGLNTADGLLSDATEHFVSRRIAKARQCLQDLQAFDGEQLSRDESQSKQILRWYLQSVVDGEPYSRHSYPVHSRGGLSDLFLSGIPQQWPLLMVHGHPLYTRQDAYNYLSRLHAVSGKFEQLQSAMLERDRQGHGAPALVLRKAIEAMEAGIAVPPHEHLLLVNFRAKLPVIKDVGDAQRGALTQMVAAAMTDSVYPAYRRLIEACRGLLERAPAACSLSARERGADYYRYLLRKHTTLSTPPEVLHALAHDETLRLCEAMRSRIGSVDLGGWQQHRARTSSQESLLDFAQSCIQRAGRYLDQVVPRPLAKPVKAAPMLGWMRAHAGQGYYEAPSCLTGGFGVFHLNLDKLMRDEAVLPTLTAHETIPGHHLQSVYLYNRDPVLPPFRGALPFRGYTEGWAVYAEGLLAELGFYENDSYGDLGRLETALRRSVRLLLDTGIHYHGWSVDEAGAQAKAMLGELSWLDEEIERVCIEPAAGAAYKCGELALLRLRELAKAKAGMAFDLRAFHHQVLEVGPCPLPLLDDIVIGREQTEPALKDCEEAQSR